MSKKNETEKSRGLSVFQLVQILIGLTVVVLGFLAGGIRDLRGEIREVQRVLDRLPETIPPDWFREEVTKLENSFDEHLREHRNGVKP